MIELTNEDWNRLHGTRRETPDGHQLWDKSSMGWQSFDSEGIYRGMVYPDHEKIPSHIRALARRLGGRPHLYRVK